MKKQTTGLMRQTVKLLGTDLLIKKGTKVKLIAATNLPKPNFTKWFARPFIKKGIWKKQDTDTSILVECPKEVWLL